MIGATRAMTTLLAVAAAGFLFWVGAKVVDPLHNENISAGDYWLWMATLAAAGFVMALSQLIGGWTKWGWPRISMPVFVGAFLPGLVAGLWVLFFQQPGSSWMATHVRNWSDDIGIDNLVSELGIAVPAIAFALGLLFGLSFDTTGPVVAREAIPAETEPVEASTPVTAVQGGPRAEPAEPVMVGADGDRQAEPVEPDDARATTPRDDS
jgi:hypothetical protein